MANKKSDESIEIVIHPDAIPVSEYSWYSHPDCDWVKKFNKMIQSFKKDQGIKNISTDRLMGLVLLNIQERLREQGFIPASLSKAKIDNLIPKLLNQKQESPFDAVAEKEFWYYADSVMEEFGQTELDPAFMFIGLLIMKSPNHYVDFFDKNGVEQYFVFKVAEEVFEGKTHEEKIVSEDSSDDPSGKSREYICTKCGRKFEQIYYEVIDCEKDSVAVKAIEHSTLNQIVCPHCKNNLGATAAVCLNRSKKWIIVFDPQHSIHEDALQKLSDSFENFSEFMARIVYDNTSLLETYMCLNLDIDQRIVEALRHAKVADGSWKKPMYLVDIDNENESLCFIPVGETNGEALTVKEIAQTIPDPVFVNLPTGKFLTPKAISMNIEVGEVFKNYAKRKMNTTVEQSNEKDITCSEPHVLSDLIRQAGLDPARCKLVRHSGTNRQLITCIKNPAFFEAYQASQRRPVFDNCDYILIFLGESGTTARFLGCCKVNGRKELSENQMPEGYPYPKHFLESSIFYDLKWTDSLKEYWNKLIIDWGKGTVAWCQSATNEKNIISINDVDSGALIMTLDVPAPNICPGKEPFEKAKDLLSADNGEESQTQAWNLFIEAFYQGYPDEMLEKEANILGEEFQYLLARLYLNWDYRRINFRQAMKYAKMAADGGRKHALELYQTIAEQLQ